MVLIKSQLFLKLNNGELAKDVILSVFYTTSVCYMNQHGTTTTTAPSLTTRNIVNTE